jgi:hypothetical protein
VERSRFGKGRQQKLAREVALQNPRLPDRPAVVRSTGLARIARLGPASSGFD